MLLHVLQFINSIIRVSLKIATLQSNIQLEAGTSSKRITRGSQFPEFLPTSGGGHSNAL